MNRSILPMSALLRRRLLLAAGAGLLTVRTRADDASPAARAAPWIASAEQTLRSGRPAAAAELFERASRIDDDAATAELGMMRAYLQAGDYAHALAWGRLVAGEHPHAPEAAAWADAVDALAHAPRPGEATPSGMPPLPGPDVDAPALPRTGLQRIGCGLIDGARQRLLVAPELARRLAEGPLPWIVDGTGSTWRMTDADGRLRREAAPGAEPAAASLVPPVRGVRARPGRPVLLLHPAVAGWPRLAAGLLTFPAAGERALGLASAGPAAPDGSPVFDACGDWLGWTREGRLEQAPVADGDATACQGGPGGDVASLYGKWYAAAAIVWRAAA